MAVEVVDAWHGRYAELRIAWDAISRAGMSRERAEVGAWSGRLAQMRATRDELVARGAWRGGPRTLLAALALQYRELPLTAGLGWLVRPDGHHGLGASVIEALLGRLRPELHPAMPTGTVRVVLEETRADGAGRETRADLVIYGDDWTVVVEAKTFAIEQDDQLDRLWRLWRDDPDPEFVFLTRGQRTPTTAVDSAGQWRSLTWEQVAGIVSTAAGTRTGVAPGVHDYIATLESYHRV